MEPGVSVTVSRIFPCLWQLWLGRVLMVSR